VSITKTVDGDRTTFVIVDESSSAIRRLLHEQGMAGAHPFKTLFQTYMGTFTLRELKRYLFGRDRN